MTAVTIGNRVCGKGQPLLWIAGPCVIESHQLTLDIALRLAGQGHRGPILAVSRHGLAPQRHQGGGSWRPFLDAVTPGSPVFQ